MKTQDYLVLGLFDGLMQAKKEQEENENMIDQNIFTENEKVILESLKQELRWIARDKDGSLFVYKAKPERCDDWFGVHSQDIYEITMTFRFSIGVFNHLFKNVTWKNSPIRFRAEVLDEVEKAYLKIALKPFQKRIAYVKKLNTECGGLQYIKVMLKNSDWMAFPVFWAGTMYRGMTVGKKYSLEDLGIRYD